MAIGIMMCLGSAESKKKASAAIIYISSAKRTLSEFKRHKLETSMQETLNEQV